MKKVVLIAIYCFSYIFLAAQQVEPLIFREKSFNFGEITEEGGNADHEFVFTNTGSRPISILSVQASCGCTTPGWTRQPIASGKTGSIIASFDPKGRPGYFSKTLTVTTDFAGGPIMLEIKGEVVITKREVSAADFPVKNGNLRFKAASFNLNKVYNNKETPAKEFVVYNEGVKPIHFLKSTTPAYVKVLTPDVLNPKDKGVIKVLYDGKQRNQYGFVTDNVEVQTDDELQPLKSFAVYATLEEFFPVRSGLEIMKAPVLMLDVNSLDLERLKLGASITRDVVLKNAGKEDLIIRALQGNCSCLASTIDSQKLKAGEETKLHITFIGQGRGGTQQKALTVYSTDLQNPIQRITITAYVEE